MSYHAQIELLQNFVARRGAIVAAIDQLLNCQKKPLDYQQNFALLSLQLDACFFHGMSGAQAALRDALEQAHWDGGFKPRAQPGNALVDPVEQMLRVFHLWRQTRWPGQNARQRFAQTLFNLYIVRRLTLLVMRLWDEAPAEVPQRLAQAQSVLDNLWQGSPSDQPRLVRDVRWLFPVAMSPTTDSLAGYFSVAERIASTFTEADRVETQRAWVVTGAGHLRSQLHDLAKRRNVGIDDPALVLLTRVSNALDVALLMEGLATLMQAYRHALERGDAAARRTLGCAICQGLSPDPELFVNRLDLLGPYTMLEHLFIEADAAGASYTPAGERHLALLASYQQLIARLAPSLLEDCRSHKPAEGEWSPYGALYGFASNLLELTAFKAVQHDAPANFSMEDVFSAGDASKLAWINGWRRLPHVRPEIAAQFEFPRQFAQDIAARVERELQQRVAGAAAPKTGRLFIVQESSAAGVDVPELAPQYVVSTDQQLVASGRATAKGLEDLLHCRNEGEFLVSYAHAGGWTALTKDLLTEVLGAGHDAKVSGLPASAAHVLKAMCPALCLDA